MIIALIISIIINCILIFVFVVKCSDYDIMENLRQQALDRNDEIYKQRNDLQAKLNRIREILRQ